jgi:hypothetical protein
VSEGAIVTNDGDERDDVVEVGGRTARWPWVVVCVAGVVAAASTAFFWLNRPEWGYCVDGPDWGYCDTGVFSSNAIIATALVVIALAGLILVVVRAPAPRRARVVRIAAIVFGVLLIVAWLLQLVTFETVAIPNGPPR